MSRALEGILIDMQPLTAASLAQVRVQARPSRATYTVNPAPSMGAPANFGKALAHESRSLAGPAVAPARYTIQSGDTLTGIVGRHLKAQGQSASGSAVYEGVQSVARANGLSNPNRISPGQSLDLSVLDRAGQGGPAPVRRPIGLASWLGQTANRAADEPGSVSRRLEAILAPKVPAQTTGAGLVDGEVELSSVFGVRRDPFTGERALHAGVDLAAERGSEIRPYREGEVVFSGWQRGYGRIVVVRHANGLESAYAHNEKNLVRVGDQVTADTVLAQVGSSGRSTGPHVHFEVRKHGRPVNPLPYLATMQLAKAK